MFFVDSLTLSALPGATTCLETSSALAGSAMVLCVQQLDTCSRPLGEGRVDSPGILLMCLTNSSPGPHSIPVISGRQGGSLSSSLDKLAGKRRELSARRQVRRGPEG